ncbi:MAG: leucine dehydrogenase [Proteobacteria bacterium]|nr:leucine dehydrogenase [Pseudomonadota bacterium]
MTSHTSLVYQNPQEFISFLKQNNIKRFSLVLDQTTNQVKVSDGKLQQLADFINTDKRDFMQHEGMLFQVSENYDVLFGAFIHITNRGQASGGLRYWHYATMEDFLRDGMRLSKGMTRKNALANLWWGGGKGIMIHNPSNNKNDPKMREELYKDYGRFITSIKGCYITAEDVGTCEEDMGNVFSQTRFTTCIPASVGGSGNPSSATALGVVHGMEAALKYLNMGTLEGKTVAVQGMGHVAEPMMGYIFERNVAKIIAVDINQNLIDEVKAKYADNNLEARLVDIKDNSILFEKCDILAPCATGAILNNESISQINANIICGASNNQLKDSLLHGQAIADRGITYVPDFLVNRMGIVNCADEQSGYIDNDPYFYRHLDQDFEYSVFQTALRVLQQSQSTKNPPAQVAIKLADELAIENNPIYGHRGSKIIQSLVNNRWHEGL